MGWGGRGQGRMAFLPRYGDARPRTPLSSDDDDDDDNDDDDDDDNDDDDNDAGGEAEKKEPVNVADCVKALNQPELIAGLIRTPLTHTHTHTHTTRTTRILARAHTTEPPRALLILLIPPPAPKLRKRRK